MKKSHKVVLASLPVWIVMTAMAVSPPNATAFALSPTSTPTPFSPNFEEVALVDPEQPTQPSQQKVKVEKGDWQLNGEWEKEILAIEEILVKESKDEGLNPQLYASTIRRESYTNCPDGPVTMSCVSSAGAIGPAQVMPSHYEDWEDKTDLRLNLEKGAQILSDYIELMGSVRAGLAAYNCGPSNYDHKQCWDYADEVLEIFYDHVRHALPNSG